MRGSSGVRAEVKASVSGLASELPPSATVQDDLDGEGGDGELFLFCWGAGRA